MATILNLPKPSDQLIELVKTTAINSPINYQSHEWHKSIQPSYIKCAAGNFFANNQVSSLAIQEYKPFFTDDISPLVGIIRNVESTPSAYPPHSDRMRFVGVNYYIETGGEDVQTVFYNKTDPEDDLIGGHVLPYGHLPEVTYTERYVSGLWYALSTRQYHSVENIETERIILTIWVKTATFNDFLNKYNHLII